MKGARIVRDNDVKRTVELVKMTEAMMKGRVHKVRENIKLKWIKFYGYHVLFPEENKLGQIFVVHATLFTSLEKAGRTDRMEDSIHYGEVFEAIEEIVEGKPKNLIET